MSKRVGISAATRSKDIRDSAINDLLFFWQKAVSRGRSIADLEMNS
jgi:hypothetical protein